MATDLERLVLQLEVNMRSYERGMARAAAVANHTTTGIENRFARADRQVSQSFRNMARAGVTAFAVIAGARAVLRAAGQLIQVSDTYQQLTNQVNSASAAVGYNLATMEDIANVARRSRTSLQGTAMLYTRLERSVANLNLTQEQTLRITELVGMSFAASGATIQEQRSSILQLSQALQSGILQGDELRSLREGAPEIARAIATEMGVGIGALKELGSQGLITTDVVARGILNAGAAIEGQFDRTRATVAQAMENLRTAFTMAVGSSEEAGGATGALAEAIIEFADAIDDNKEGIASFVELIGNLARYSVIAAAGVGDLFAGINTGIDRFERTNRNTETFRPVTEQEFTSEMASVRNAASRLSELDAGEMLGQTRANQLRNAIGPDLLNAEEISLDAYTRSNAQLTQTLTTALDYRLQALQLGLDNLTTTSDSHADYLAQRGLDGNDRRGQTNEQISADARAERLAAEAEAARIQAILDGPDGDVTPRFAPRVRRDALRDTAKNEALLDFERVVAETLAASKETAHELGIEQAEAFKEELADSRQQFSQEFGDVFAAGMMEAFDGDLLQFIQRQLQEAMFNALSNAFARVGEQVFDQLFSDGGGGGILGGIASTLLGGKNAGIPGKALGGPVRAGQPYVVGEHGPELMIPDKAGRIVPQLPSASAAAMITYAPKYAIDARGATPDAVAALRREMAATRAADLQQFGTRVRGVLPGALASAQRDGAV